VIVSAIFFYRRGGLRVNRIVVGGVVGGDFDGDLAVARVGMGGVILARSACSLVLLLSGLSASHEPCADHRRHHVEPDRRAVLLLDGIVFGVIACVLYLKRSASWPSAAGSEVRLSKLKNTTEARGADQTPGRSIHGAQRQDDDLREQVREFKLEDQSG